MAHLTIGELRAQRKEMAWRKRRIIFNNDGDDLAHPEADTAAGLLKARTEALVGSQVDAIWYYSTFGMKLHQEDGPYGRLYRCPGHSLSIENARKLIAHEGRDALEITIDFCRQHGLEIFYSNRMNDSHDSLDTSILYDIRRDHPEWSLGTQEEGGKYDRTDIRSRWSVWNFERPEIRGLTVAALREVCATYDIDGLEIDFRGKLYFPPTMRLEAVTQQHIDMMNEMMREIRKATEEEGLRRGRAILVAARCADDLELSPQMGLDVETWLKEGLIDILQTGVSMTPVGPLIELAHRYEVPAYPLVNVKYKAEGYLDRAVWRGEALLRWAQGGDGIYMFNVFDPTQPLWWELGDPEKLVKLDTSYVCGRDPLPEGSRDIAAKLTVRESGWPIVLSGKGGGEAVKLPVGQNLAEPVPEGKRRSLDLRIYVTGMTPAHRLLVKLNGNTLDDGILVLDAEAPALRDKAKLVCIVYHDPHPSVFRLGSNELEFSLAGGSGASDSPLSIEQVRLDCTFS